MDITRKSALRKMGALVGTTALMGFTRPRIASGDQRNSDYNVKDYGAKGDGQTSDTNAINDTIAAAAKAGGGRVYFPSGTYLTGSIHLKSNVSLYLEQAAVLEAISDSGSYDPAEPFSGKQYQDFGHSHWHNSLIWGEDLQNISILGPGMIYGKGLLRNVAKNASEKGLGNKSIALKNCRNVILKDFIIKHGGWFGILATGVDNFTIDNLKIDTNRDGMDIDACRNVRVSNCSVNSPYDDAICPKSSYALGYARSTEDVTITNCMVSGFQEGTLLDGTFKPYTDKERSNPTGRIKFGTESNGGFKNITISNCVFNHCRGLALETVDGALLEDVSISNITMRNVGNAPIFMRLGSRMRGPSSIPIGQIRRVNIDNVVVSNADNKTGVLISGIPNHPIKDIKISNVRIEYEGGGTKEDAGIEPPEKADGYPEPGMFGKMPSYGFYLRHVEGIEITNVKLSYQKDDARPAFVLHDVKDADFRFIKVQRGPNSHAFSLNNVEDFSIYDSESMSDTKISKADHKLL